MTSFRYIGDIGVVETLGMVFERKIPVEVPDEVATKLRGNPSFEEVSKKEPVAVAEIESPRRPRGRPPIISDDE